VKRFLIQRLEQIADVALIRIFAESNWVRMTNTRAKVHRYLDNVSLIFLSEGFTYAQQAAVFNKQSQW
jgi:hypothetical protein